MKSVDDSGNKILAEQTVNLVGEYARDLSRRAPEAGQTFADRYEILEKLGEGGVGTVYKARHIHLDTILAIKILQSTHLKDQDSVARFNREGKLISKLSHSNIVKVQEFGVYDGCPYMTMDYIDGVPISKLIDSNTSADTWVSIFRQVLDAIAHAHERGIIHRDIKPGNILYRLDETGAPVITVVDFGLAKAIDSQEEVTDTQALTRTGDLFGTPLYMSPEQCTGAQIDSRCDIYSLGCVMYHCLTGAPPFQGQSNFELVYRQINCSPSNFLPELRQRGVGADLEAIVLKAMAKRQSSRYQFAQQMAVDLLNTRERKHSVVSELLSKLRVMNGRLKASQRAAILRHTTTIVATINALITAAFLFYLPPQMEKENLLVNRYINVMVIMQDFIHSDMFKDQDLIKEGLIHLLKTTREDKELRPLAVKHVKLVQAASNATKTSLLQTQRQLEENAAFSLLSNGMRVLADTVHFWMDSSASNARLTAKASDLLNRNYDSLRWKYMLYSVLPTYGALSCLVLAWLIGQNLLARSQEQRRLQDQANGPNIVMPITNTSV